MSHIEGIGDEVIYFFGLVGVLAILAVAWLSTSVRPLWTGDSVWFVHLESEPNRRVVQLVQIDERSAAELEQSTQTRMVRLQEQVVDGEEPRLVPVASTSAAAVTPAVVDATQASAEGDGPKVDTDDSTVAAPPEVTSEPTPEPDTTIRLKFLDETQKLVSTWCSQTVGEFKRLNFRDEVSSGRTIRLIYQGQLLRDDARSLESYGLTDNCIVHCHVSNVPYQGNNGTPGTTTATNTQSTTTTTGLAAPNLNQPRPTATGRAAADNANATGGMFMGEGGGLGIGRYTSLIFAVKFGMLWAFFAMYPHQFDFSSFFSLILCTVIYLAFMYHSHGLFNLTNVVRRGQPPPQQQQPPQPQQAQPQPPQPQQEQPNQQQPEQPQPVAQEVN